jgi:hypothetical protein
VKVSGFEHRPGVHCGSTALADVLRRLEVEVSEAMAFGLGAGLGFHYQRFPSRSPSHVFHGRSVELERTACEVLRIPCQERTEVDPERAWDEVRAAVDRGETPILSTDLAELPYWKTATPFGGHRVVLAGYEPDRAVALVADTGWPGLQEVPLDALRRARATTAFPLGAARHPWLEIALGGSPAPLPEAVRDALARQARDMLRPRDGSAGVSALERLAEDLPRWPADARDPRDLVRCLWSGYQMIDGGGTGGGLFRAMYAAFLGEAEQLLRSLRRLGLRSRMDALAARWTTIAAAMRRSVRLRERALPATLAALVIEVAREERLFYEELAACSF